MTVSRPASDRTARPSRVTIALLAVACLGAIVGCGGGNDDEALAAEIVTTTAKPATTTSPTTTTATSTTATTTTSTSTTTTLLPPRQMTQPIAPPQDERSPENNPSVGRIEIPKIGLDKTLEEGIRLTTLDRGPGHWPGSAMPGEIGNVVVAGHRTSHDADFRHINELEPGDPVIFTTDTGTYTYLVSGTQIVTPDALWITYPSNTQTATLFACHPIGSTAERIVVNLVLSA
jgi:sortase A